MSEGLQRFREAQKDDYNDELIWNGLESEDDDND